MRAQDIMRLEPLIINRVRQTLAKNIRIPFSRGMNAEIFQFHLQEMIEYTAKDLVEDILLYCEVCLPINAEESRRVTYPADWWQAFKERWACRWWKRKYPVKYKEVTLKIKIDLREIFDAWALAPDERKPFYMYKQPVEFTERSLP